MLEIVEINDIDDLQPYRLLWNSLFPATPGASFFRTFDWLDTYWRHFGHDQKLRVLIAYAAGQPLGILPLCVRRESYHFGNVRVLTYPLDDWGGCYGPIGPNPAATFLAATQHIRRTPRDWDMIELRWVADDAAGKTTQALRCAGLFSEKHEHVRSSIVDVPLDFDEFLANKSPSLRQTLSNFSRAEYIRHRPGPANEGDGDPRWDLYELCETVAPTSCQSHATNENARGHVRIRDFLRDAHAAAARLGMLDMNVLTVDGRPAAYLYGYHTQGNYSALWADIDASAGSDVGAALLLKSIEDSCRRGDRKFDLSSEASEHAQLLRPQSALTYRLTYTPLDSLRSQAVRLSRWARFRWTPRAASM